MVSKVGDAAEQQLAVMMSHLRLGLRDGGIRIGVKGGHALTPYLKAIIAAATWP